MTSFKPKDNKYHGHAHDSLRIYLFYINSSGRVLASISSRPGQCGRSDGYVLEVIYLFFVNPDNNTIKDEVYKV